MASTEDAFARYEQRVKEATASLAAEVAALRQAAEAGVATPAAGTGSSAAGTAAVSRDAASSREDKRQLLHEKVFVARESLLTHMLNGDESFRAIYNAMIAVLLWLGVKLVLQNWETQGRLLDVDSLAWAFGKMDIVLYTWVPMMVASFLVIPLVQFLRAHPNSWTAFKRAAIAYIALQVFLFAFVTYRALTHRLPPASGLIVTCECARLSMKMHAYVREKVVHGLRHHYKAVLVAGGGSGATSTPASPAAGTAACVEGGAPATVASAAAAAAAPGQAGSQASERKEETVSPTAASMLTPMASSEVSPASSGTSGAPTPSASGASAGSAPGDAPTAPSSAPNSARSVDVGSSAAASSAAVAATPSPATNAAGKATAAAAAAPLPVESFQDRLERFANFLPAAAARAGVAADSLRASQPVITIGDTNEEIGRLMFFNFAPTIVYRDSYPRNPGPIHWMRAGIHVLNLAGVVLYTYVILRSVLVPLLHEKRSEARGPVMDVVMLVQGAMVPAILVFLLSFFGILHSWLNVWAELLRFADRQFYASWWTATTWSAYYRRWNQVVGDNLHSYIYNDVQRAGYSRATAETCVFVLSAFIHEWILAISFRFWYPALLLMFGGPGVYFMNLTRKMASRFSNVFMWMMLSAGLAILTVMYSRELYSRYGHEWAGMPGVPADASYLRNPHIHPHDGWGVVDYISYVLVPRSWLEFVGY